MDGIIEVKVNGHSISKDNTCAGAQFEENSTKLRLTFSDNWDGYAKTITFWNALGENPVKRVLTTDLLEDITLDKNVYLIPIPGEAMTESGKNTFVIDGYIDGIRKRTVRDGLIVLPSKRTENAGQPQDPTPTQAEQLQGQIEKISGDIVYVAQAKEEVQDAVTRAETAAQSASQNAQFTEAVFMDASVAKDSAREAEKGAKEAQKAIEEMTVSSEILEAGETATVEKKQVGGVVDLHFGIPMSSSGVHIGEDEPSDANVNVWIVPDGKPDGFEGINIVSAHDDLSTMIPADGEQYLVRYDSMPYVDKEGKLVELEKLTYILKIGDGKTSLSELQPTNNIIPGNDGEGSLVQVIDYEIDELYIDPNTEEVKFPRSTVTGKASVAFGRYNEVHGRESAAFNYDNTVNGKWSFAANQNNTVVDGAENIFVAGGTNNKVGGDQGAVLGSANKGSGRHYVLLGDNNTLGDGATFVKMLGRGLTSNGNDQVLLGNFNVEDNDARIILASGDADGNRRNSIVIKQNGSIVLNGGIEHNGAFKKLSVGASNNALGNYDACFGYKNKTSNYYSFAFGENNQVSASSAAAVGENSKVTKKASLAAGSGLEVNGQAAAVFGSGNKTEGAYTLVGGYGNEVKGGYASFVAGHDNTVDKEASGSVGYQNTVNAVAGFITGAGNNISEGAIASFIWGNSNKANGYASMAGGTGTITSQRNQIALGKYNAVDDNALFMIGNGTSDTDRKNAFTVNDDNSITVGSTKITEEQFIELLSLPSKIGAALDELHAYAVALVNGGEK